MINEEEVNSIIEISKIAGCRIDETVNGIFVKLQEKYRIESGDISPLRAQLLEDAKKQLIAVIVCTVMEQKGEKDEDQV